MRCCAWILLTIATATKNTSQLYLFLPILGNIIAVVLGSKAKNNLNGKITISIASIIYLLGLFLISWAGFPIVTLESAINIGLVIILLPIAIWRQNLVAIVNIITFALLFAWLFASH